MKIHSTPLTGLCVVETTPHTDNRGQFARLYCESELNNLIGARKIVQINHSRTTAVGAVRGMHYQLPPHAEMKLVRCLKGRVWDVAVDLRQDSATFLHWHAEDLSAVNNKMMVIPEGFAHGFQALELDSELLYLHTASYTRGAEGGLKYDDPMLKITWPLKPAYLSMRDSNHAYLDTSFRGIVL
jgi:dTDP-4-dehydrorhamnose 3,5-epimerase